MEITAEFEGADLGDERLNRRLVWLGSQLAEEPGASFPDVAGGDAALEATYRFLGNERVSPGAILAPHVRQTLLRAARQAGPVVVAHDTTEFNFGDSPRRDLGRVGRGKSFGFYGHFAFAVSLTDMRQPLGLVGLRVHQRAGNQGRRGHTELQTGADNEGRRWEELVEDVAQTAEGLDVLHVMDREADSYALMAAMVERGRRFVIRMAQGKRKLADEEADLRVHDVLERAQTVCTRTVPLSKRGVSKLPSYRKHHPPRKGRLATLHVSCQTLTIKRPDSSSRSPTPKLALNVVRVFEPSPPEGEEAVEWRLWTTEHIETAEQALVVVDAYRCRWVIEEYFRALKEGCRVEWRQLESMHGLLNALALFAPVAWRLLALRTLAREQPDAPAALVLNLSQLHCLRFALKRNKHSPLPDLPTTRQVLMAVAAIGGHIKNNGDPGWIVLGRGLDKLLAMETGYLAALREM